MADERDCEKISQLNEQKSDLIFQLSHDIRSPLNSIIGYSEIMLREIDDIKQQKRLSQIIAQADSILDITNNLLNIIKIERNQLIIQENEFSLSSLLEIITSIINVKAVNRQVSFRITRSMDIPDNFIGDEIRIKEILLNVLSEMILNARNDQLTLDITYAKQSDKQYTIGFHSRLVPIREDENTYKERNIVRADILPIIMVKVIIAHLKGEYITHNRDRQIDIIIPVRKAETIPNVVVDVPRDKKEVDFLESKKVLVAEDYIPNQAIISYFLEQEGFNVDIVENGEKAVLAVQSQNYDLVLMDIQMPVCDGYDATKQIRQKYYTKEELPIIGLTAHKDTFSIDRCYMVGMNDVINKPVRFHDLIEKINQVISLPAVQQDMQEENNPEMCNTQYIDYQEALSDFSGNENILQNLIGQFLVTVENRLPDFHTWRENKDYQSIMQEAHRIRGGALNLMAPFLAATAAALEEAAKDKAEHEVCSALQDLLREYTNLRNYVFSMEQFSNLNP